MKIFNNKDGSHLAFWLEHGTLKKQNNLRWDEWLEDGKVGASWGLAMGVGCCLHWALLPSGP